MGAEMLEDTYPHGTIAGYRGGCRGGNCAAVISCRDVFRRYSGDYTFKRLIDAGVPLEEILRRDEAEREGVAVRDRQAARATQRKDQAAVVAKREKQDRPERIPRAGIRPEVKRLHAERLTDQEMAERLKVTRAYIGIVRRELHLPANLPPRPEAQARPARPTPARVTVDPQAEHEKAMAEWQERRKTLTADIRTAAAAVTKAERTLAAAQTALSELHASRPTRPEKARVVTQPKPRELQPHGTNAAYARGCRCDECKTAARAYHQDWMAKRREKTEAIPVEHHGTPYGYQLGCRSRSLCPAPTPCADASLLEERRRRREAGSPEQAPRVDADPVREHVRQLMSDGMSVLGIAEAAGVSKSGLKTLLYGRSGDRKGEFPAEVEAEKAARIFALERTSA